MDSYEARDPVFQNCYLIKFNASLERPTSNYSYLSVTRFTEFIAFKMVASYSLKSAIYALRLAMTDCLLNQASQLDIS